MNFLVFGADGFLGRHLVSYLVSSKHSVLASTRSNLELTKSQAFLAPSGFDYAFICCAVADYRTCEEQSFAHSVNVEAIPKLVAVLLAQGVHVCFLSSNTVFGGVRELPEEDSEHDPRIAYAWQKSEAEKRIGRTAKELHCEERLTVVRLTKIICGRQSPPIVQWLEAWEKGESVWPFWDLVFAPISISYVVESLSRIAERKTVGNLHLSGEDVTYVKFARLPANHKGVSQDLVIPTTSKERGVELFYQPTFSALGMEKTTRLTGIERQRTMDCIHGV